MYMASLHSRVLGAALLGVFAAACTPDQPANTASGALTASPAARAFGVEQYLVSADAVSVLGTGGAELGLLRVSTPSADVRLIEMTMSDLGEYQNELTRPTAGTWKAPIAGDTREVAIQVDPVLAPFFTRHAIELTKVVPTTEALASSSVARCEDVTWVNGCYPCGSSSPHACYVSTFSGGTVAHAWARCTPTVCGASKDLVAKDRTCYDAGGCSQQALGFQGCVAGDCWPE